jgi:hypothetical protein
LANAVNSAEADPAAGSAPRPLLVLHVERGRIVGPSDLSSTPEWARPIVAAALSFWANAASGTTVAVPPAAEARRLDRNHRPPRRCSRLDESKVRTPTPLQSSRWRHRPGLPIPAPRQQSRAGQVEKNRARIVQYSGDPPPVGEPPPWK